MSHTFRSSVIRSVFKLTRVRIHAVDGMLPVLLALMLCVGTPAIADGGEVLRVASVSSTDARAVGAQQVSGSVESEIAREAAQRWQLVVDAGSGQPNAGRARAGGQAPVRLRAIADVNALSEQREVISIGQQVTAAALVRPGAAIGNATQLKGRTVCVARDGKHVGVAAALHGAVEQSHSTLTTALVALRNGECDAVMHDDTVLLELARRPEWAQYAAPFTVGEARTLAFIVPSVETAVIAQLKKLAGDWKAQGYPANLAKRVAADVTLAVQRQSGLAESAPVR